MRFSPALLLSLLMLGGGTATLAHGLSWQPDLSSPVIDAAPPPRMVQAEPSGGTRDDAQVQGLIDRPLFTVGRRLQQPVPTASEETEQPAVVADLAVPIVRGIALSGRSSVAIVSLDGEKNRLHRIALGNEIGGWRITTIRRGSVTFSNSTTEATVHLGKPGGEPQVEIVHRNPELAEKVDEGAPGVSAEQPL